MDEKKFKEMVEMMQDCCRGKGGMVDCCAILRKMIRSVEENGPKKRKETGEGEQGKENKIYHEGDAIDFL